MTSASSEGDALVVRRCHVWGDTDRAGDVGEEPRGLQTWWVVPPRDLWRATLSIGAIGTNMSVHRTSNRPVDAASSSAAATPDAVEMRFMTVPLPPRVSSISLRRSQPEQEGPKVRSERWFQPTGGRQMEPSPNLKPR